jgi:hypothetical protein
MATASGEISSADISALVAWQATLPAPVQMIPEAGWMEKPQYAGRNNVLDFGCTVCHRPALPLESSPSPTRGPFDRQERSMTARSSARRSTTLR